MNFRVSFLLAACLLAPPLLAAPVAPAAPASVSALPSGFHLAQPLTGRFMPTSTAFAHDGRVFVIEKSGLVWVYRNLLDTQPVLFADLTQQVYNYIASDRGLLGIALHPRFPEVPYVYVQYAYNGGLGLGGPVPRWPGDPDMDGFDDCPPAPGGVPTETAPGSDTPGGGCVIAGRISRLTADGNSGGDEVVLLEDWYQQFSSHSIGTLLFGPDGYLYAGGGEGASFYGADFGQWGNPWYPDERSPLDPDDPWNVATSHGGALRAQGLEVQDLYAAKGSDVWLDGTIVRIDPATGLGAPGNPLADGDWPNARRIVAYGLRNPFRFTFRPGSGGELWIGNVGYNRWESIDVLPPVTAGAAALRNFGWPCYEGDGPAQDYVDWDLPICLALYNGGSNDGGRTPWTRPWYTYPHVGGSDITGLAFYQGDSYPEAYRGSLFFADNSRTVLFNIPDSDGDGIPDSTQPGAAAEFAGGSNVSAVDLVSGPGGDLFLTHINPWDGSGNVTRLYWCDSAPDCDEQAPSAAIALAEGSVADGPPRTIAFTAANTVDPNAGDTLSWDWDLDGDGVFGDASGETATRAYTADGSYRVAVRATDATGRSDVQSMWVTVTTADDIFADGFDGR